MRLYSEAPTTKYENKQQFTSKQRQQFKQRAAYSVKQGAKEITMLRRASIETHVPVSEYCLAYNGDRSSAVPHIPSRPKNVHLRNSNCAAQWSCPDSWNPPGQNRWPKRAGSASIPKHQHACRLLIQEARRSLTSAAKTKQKAKRFWGRARRSSKIARIEGRVSSLLKRERERERGGDTFCCSELGRTEAVLRPPRDWLKVLIVKEEP